jgi:predicted 2-oxoglutarate/Fe(II)-dependent dioxygenase YbiX
MRRVRAIQAACHLYRRPGFLGAEDIERVKAAIGAGQAEAAEVLGDAMAHDEAVRRAASIEVDGGTLRFVEARLDRHLTEVAGAFRVSLTSREGPSFLRYGPGGRYRPHRDRADVPSWPDAARRRIAAVVFLDSSRDADRQHGTFDGGVLRLLPDGGAPLVEIPPAAGLLVAFPADRLHEVTAVRGGTRHAIVDWYYA